MAASNLGPRIDELNAALRRYFPVDPAPASDRLVDHECDECLQLAADLGGRRWTDIGDGLIDSHVWRLGLLTPGALRYYLPAFLARTLRPAGDDYVDPILYDLCSVVGMGRADRFATLDPGQKTVVCAWLKLVTDFHEHFGTDLEEATELIGASWKEECSKLNSAFDDR